MPPSVCAVMLVNGREKLVARAIKSFREQTYPNKWLLMFDTGELPFRLYQGESETDLINHVIFGTGSGIDTIGGLRNEANSICSAEILVHWDSDDWSHPRRIEEQVALLQASGKQCVGYCSAIFYNETEGQFCGAWEYLNHNKKYCIGASLAYWRTTWEQRPFEDLPKKKGGTGEDTKFLQGLDSLGVLRSPVVRGYGHEELEYEDEQPRMICSIHGGNSSYYGHDLLKDSTSWRRVPEFDDYCRGIMSGK